MAISLYFCVLVGWIIHFNVLLVLSINVTYYYLISNLNKVIFSVKLVLKFLNKSLNAMYIVLCLNISYRYNRIVYSINSIKYNIRYLFKLTLKLSKKPTIVIMKLLFRYFIRSEFIISFKLAKKYPTSFYYFVKYNHSLPFLIISIIRVYNFIFLNHVLIENILYEFKILENLLGNYVYIFGEDPMKDLHESSSNNPGSPKIPKGDDYIVVSSDSDSSDDDWLVKTKNIGINRNVLETSKLDKSAKTVQESGVDSSNTEPTTKGKNRIPTDKEYSTRQKAREHETRQKLITDKLSVNIIVTEPTEGANNHLLNSTNKDDNLLAPPAKNAFGRAIIKDTSSSSDKNKDSLTSSSSNNSDKFINTGPSDYKDLYASTISSSNKDSRYLKTLTNDDLLLFYVGVDSSSDEEDAAHIDGLSNLPDYSHGNTALFINTTSSDYKYTYEEIMQLHNYKKRNLTNRFKPYYANLKFTRNYVPKNFVAGPLDLGNLEFAKNLELKHIDAIPEVKVETKPDLSKLRRYLEEFEEGYHDTDYESESNSETRGEKRVRFEEEDAFDEMYSRKRVRFDLEHFRNAISSKLKPKNEELVVIPIRTPCSSPIALTDNSESNLITSPVSGSANLDHSKPSDDSIDLFVHSDSESHDSLYSVSSDDDSDTKRASKKSSEENVIKGVNKDLASSSESIKDKPEPVASSSQSVVSNSQPVVDSSKSIPSKPKKNFGDFWKNLYRPKQEVSESPHVYKWVSNDMHRLENMYEFANTKHPKLDFCTFTGDYLGGGNDLRDLKLLKEYEDNSSMEYGYNKFLNIFYLYNDSISGVLPNKRYYDYIFGARSNYKPSLDTKLISLSLAPGQLELGFPVNLSSYIRTVDGASTSGIDLYNMRNKSHIRDVNKVFNNYYSPGYIPEDVYPHLWLEDAYKFLLKSKFDVNRLPDGTYEYIVHELAHTPEEKETIKEEAFLLSQNKEGNNESYDSEAVLDHYYKIMFYADYIKKSIVEKAEWLFDLGHIDDPNNIKKRNSSSIIFKQWVHHNISEALKDTICVLNKHYIANNPVWPYGMQDRRWFGIAHDKYNRLHNKNGENDLFKMDDSRYRTFYNLPYISLNSLENLEYKYVIDGDGLYNSMAYLDLKESDLDMDKRKFIDKRAWGTKTSGDVAFENNPLYPENFKGGNTRLIPHTHDLLHKIDFHRQGMPIVDIEDKLRNLSLDSTAKDSYISRLSDDSSLILPGIDGLDVRINKNVPKSFLYNSFSPKKTVPKLGTKPWTFEMPSSADKFTDDCYLWENTHCRGLVPKEFTYAYDLPGIDIFRFIKVDVVTSDLMHPNGSYIYSKHNLKKIFTEFELSMKWTKETCKLIDRNNILLYYNLFHNNSVHVCLPCADKVVSYNQYLKSELSKVADSHFHENVFSHMKKTMESHYLLYTRRADSLEASYDKLMTRLSTDIQPRKVWTKVELKKEELKNVTYEERKFFRYLVLRDFEYATKYDEKFDIRGTLITEEKARKWDKTHVVEKSKNEQWELRRRVKNIVERSKSKASSSHTNK